MTTVLFAYGKESGPWGSKIRYLADIAWRLGAHAHSPDYSDLPSPEDRPLAGIGAARRRQTWVQAKLPPRDGGSEWHRVLR